VSEAVWCIEQGDCLEVLKRLPDACVDAVVTDPPAGIEFMGKAWDSFKKKDSTASGQQTATWGAMEEAKANPYARKDTPRYRGKTNESLQGFQDFIFEVFTEVYRVLKPGGHAVVWALPRTSHHTAMGMERAGFDIRDNGTYLFHVFGSGFPKSLDVSKAIDKAAGAEREKVPGPKTGGMASLNKGNAAQGYRDSAYYDEGNMIPSSEPVTDDAKRWEGWGTALKPAVEFWIVARKPLDGTVAENVLAHGTGALNIDGCRIGNEDNTSNGRWPAHLLLDEGAAAMLDEQSGVSKSNVRPPTGKDDRGVPGFVMRRKDDQERGHADAGGASRFFYVAKANKRDKDEGLDDLPERSAGEKTDREEGSAGITPFAGSRGPSKNSHPTVKPTALMSYLCRLVTPPGGVVLDPFMGSGSTGKAAILEGFSFIGIERESEYVEIARARLAHADANKEGSDE
jgi:site-specific DNA-methyltransferase (adenine-specific)